MHKTESVVTSGRFWHIFTSYLHVNASLNNTPCSVLNVHLSFNWTFNLLPAKEFSLLMQILSHFPLTHPQKSLAGVFSLLETFNFFTFASPKSVGKVGFWAGHLKGRFFFKEMKKDYFFSRMSYEIIKAGEGEANSGLKEWKQFASKRMTKAILAWTVVLSSPSWAGSMLVSLMWYTLCFPLALINPVWLAGLKAPAN